ncbi:Trm112p-like protein, partial [Musa troglodytarum]
AFDPQHSLLQHQGRHQRLPPPPGGREVGREGGGAQRRLPPSHLPQDRIKGPRRRLPLPRATRGSRRRDAGLRGLSPLRPPCAARDRRRRGCPRLPQDRPRVPHQ